MFAIVLPDNAKIDLDALTKSEGVCGCLLSQVGLARATLDYWAKEQVIYVVKSEPIEWNSFPTTPSLEAPQPEDWRDAARLVMKEHKVELPDPPETTSFIHSGFD